MERVSHWLQSFKHGRLFKQQVKTIAILSGKGGVGKTLCSLRLANDLAKCGKKVLLIDCDFNLSNTLIKLNISMDDSFEKFLSGEKSFNDCLTKRDNLHILPAASGNLKIFDNTYRMQTKIISLIDQAEKYYDFILLDCPAGISKECLNLAVYCDQRIIVLNPDRSSVTDAYSLTKILINRYGATKNQFILNRVRGTEAASRIATKFDQTTRNFLGKSANFLGMIPNIDQPASLLEQEFIFGERSSISDAISQIISKLYETAYVPTDERGLINSQLFSRQSNDLVQGVI